MVIEVYIVELLSYYMVEVHRYNEQDMIEVYIVELLSYAILFITVNLDFGQKLHII